VKLGQTHQDELAAHGWPADRTVVLSEKTTSLDERYSARVSETDASRSATQTEAQCRKKAKELITKLRLVVPMVLRDHPSPGVTEVAFKIGRPLGASTTNITKYLIQLRPFVAVLADRLAPYFAGINPVEILEETKSRLDASDTVQETRRAGLPAGTKKLNRQKGEVVEMIEDMNRVAKVAFLDTPEIAAQFNKSLIQRAKRPKRRLELLAEAV
jgi:hypothetical protein